MFPQNLCLDFEGRRLHGVRPFAFCECTGGAWTWQSQQAGFPFPNGYANEATSTLEEVRHALRWCRDNMGARGAAAGFFAYDFARHIEPRAFRDSPPDDLCLPEARLVFYEEWAREPLPAHQLLSRDQTAPGQAGFDSPTSDEAYTASVERILAYIAAGDIYQANLTRRFQSPLFVSPLRLYERLLRHPMPFSALLEWPDFAIVCNSPESFLNVKNGMVTSHPIKGTAPRGNTPEADLVAKHALQSSPKDRAENVMIVDLLRNDLGRVCEFGTVTVPALCEVQTFPTLHHLVSSVQGQLREGCDALDAFAAAFPCGSITGAPKIRAMQILEELEPVRRGAAMGSIGYFGFDGTAEWNVAIRTVTCIENKAYFHVGGGIVADSTPGAERAEIEVKAQAITQALQG